MIETSSDILQKSSATLSYLRKSLVPVIFGNILKLFGNIHMAIGFFLFFVYPQY